MEGLPAHGRISFLRLYIVMLVGLLCSSCNTHWCGIKYRNILVNDPLTNNMNNGLVIKSMSSRKVRVPVQGIIEQTEKIASGMK